MGERLRKVLGQIDLGTLDSGERSLPFGLLVRFTGSQSAETDSHIERKPHTIFRKCMAAKFCLNQEKFCPEICQFLRMITGFRKFANLAEIRLAIQYPGL